MVTKPDGTIERIGPYRVVRRIATGGTSDVLLARAEGPHGFERSVVLKVLLSEFGGDDEVKGRFVREASAYARLAHPAIVRLFDFFAVPAPAPGTSSISGDGRGSGPREGQLVMVLEYVDGPPLSRLRSMLKAAMVDLEDAAALFVATRIFAALAAAHGTMNDGGESTPVIHRDVNPSNVLVPWDGEVKLADFGIAKVTGTTPHSVAGAMRGTYGYMAPEQVGLGTVTPRADVYSAGIILWELLTKRRAFQRGALPESEAIRAMAEPRLVSIDVVRPDVDRSVRDALKRALEPRPDRRTITAEEMVAVLTAVSPPDVGRHRLVTTLGVVRNDPRAKASDLTPPKASTAPPPPLVDVDSTALTPAMKPLATVSPASPAPGAAPSTQSRATAKLPAVKPPLPSASRLPAAVPPKKQSQSTLKAPSESLIETPRVTNPNRAIADVLRSVPSSMPPSVLEGGVTPVPGAVDTPRMGRIPQAPEPMRSVPVDPHAVTVAPGAVDPGEEKPPPTPKMMPLARTMLLGPFADPPSSGDLDERLRFSPLAPPLGGGLPSSPSRYGPPPRLGAPGAVGPPTPPSPLVPFSGATAPAAPPPSPLHPLPMGPLPLPPPGEAALIDASNPQRAPSFGSPPLAPSPASRTTPPSRAGVPVGIVALALAGVVAIGIVGVVAYVRRQGTKVGGTSPAVSSVASTTPMPPPLPRPVDAPSAPPAGSGPARSAEPVSPPPEPATGTPEVTATTPPPVPPPPPSASAPPPEGMGVLQTAGAIHGRRIFVDEKVVGQTPQAVNVPCGKHTVRLGSAGKPQPVDVPCGGEVSVADKDK